MDKIICSEIRQVEGGFIVIVKGFGGVGMREIIATRFSEVIEILYQQTQEFCVGDKLKIDVIHSGGRGGRTESIP